MAEDEYETDRDTIFHLVLPLCIKPHMERYYISDVWPQHTKESCLDILINSR